MSLTGAMSKALTGMRATQAGLDVVSQNVSNADAAGYVRRQLNLVEQVTDRQSGGTRIAGIDRMLDRVVQRQLWGETSGAGYTSARSEQLTALDQLFGSPDSDSALGAVFGRFTQALQALKGDPSNYTLRSNVLTMGQEMAARLQDLSAGVQELRTQADRGIMAGVERANELLNEIRGVNQKIVGANAFDQSPALRDQRDRLVTELAGYMDIRTVESPDGSLSIFTSNGFTLFNGITVTDLRYTGSGGRLGPDQIYNSDPAQSGVGSIVAVDQIGGRYDLIASGALRSGQLAAFVELRDRTLVETQTQLDEMAAAMASALSDRQVGGTAIAGGFEVGGLASLQAGNQITVDYTDAAGFRGKVTFVRADTAAERNAIAAMGLTTADNRVVGIDLSGGLPSALAQINATLTPLGLTGANNAGNLQVTGTAPASVQALNAWPTTTGFTSPAPNGTPALPFFTDNGSPSTPFTGSFANGVPQVRGFAMRIGVNSDLIADRSRLVVYQSATPGNPATPQGDQTRADFMYDRLTNQTRVFSPLTGLGGLGGSYRSTVSEFAQRIVEQTGATVEAGKRLDEGQQVALKSVQSRFADKSAVNVDQEMASLIELQNAYAANARIISAVREMVDMLMRI